MPVESKKKLSENTKEIEEKEETDETEQPKDEIVDSSIDQYEDLLLEAITGVMDPKDDDKKD